jgi:hypothetical protein
MGRPLPLPLLYASHVATLTFTFTLYQSWGDSYIYTYFMLVMGRPLPLPLLYASHWDDPYLMLVMRPSLPLPLLYASHGATLTFTLTLCK